MRPVLRMGALAIWMLNALIFRQGEQRWDGEITRTAAYHAPDDLDDEEDDLDAHDMENLIADGDAAPALSERGCYFISAVEQDHGLFRCPITRELDAQVYAKIYNVPSWSALEQLFQEGEAKQQRKEHAGQRRNRITAIFEDERQSPEREIAFELDNVELGPSIMLTGRDITSNAIRPPDQGDVENGVSGEVNGIWRQFLRDLLRKCPSGADGPYCVLTAADIEAVTETIYQSVTLPLRSVFVKVPQKQAWDTSLFDRFFPSRAHLAKFNKPAQHFPHCGYYLRWQALINKTKGAGDEEIRASIRQEYNKLGWVPWNKADRMWIVESKETGQYSKLGVGRGQSGVRIAVNPMWGKKHSQMKLQTV